VIKSDTTKIRLHFTVTKNCRLVCNRVKWYKISAIAEMAAQFRPISRCRA